MHFLLTSPYQKVFLSFFFLLLFQTTEAHANPALANNPEEQARADQEAGKKNGKKIVKGWRSRVPYLPSFQVNLGLGFTPAYFAPSTVETKPFVNSSLSFAAGITLRSFGVKGYWNNLAMGISWGLTKALTDNIGTSNIARREYPRDIGIILSKFLYKEKITGLLFSLGFGTRIPVSFQSQQSTLITSLAPSLRVLKSFLSGYINLTYSFGTNANFFFQDSGLYNSNLAGIPGINRRWGMSHSFNGSFRIIKGLSMIAGVTFSSGYSFADNYTNPDGPQVYGAENLTAADLASFPINEGNAYGIGIFLNYRLNKYVGFNLGYRNAGRQSIWYVDEKGDPWWSIRSPFRLQDGSFSFALNASI